MEEQEKYQALEERLCRLEVTVQQNADDIMRLLDLLQGDFNVLKAGFELELIRKTRPVHNMKYLQIWNDVKRIRAETRMEEAKRSPIPWEERIAALETQMEENSRKIQEYLELQKRFYDLAQAKDTE